MSKYTIYPPNDRGKTSWSVAESDCWIMALFESEAAVRSWFGRMLEAEEAFAKLNEGRHYRDLPLGPRPRKKRAGT